MRVPTGAEQEKLAESGAFASGTPAWVTGVKSPERADAGSIPQKFSSPSFARSEEIAVNARPLPAVAPTADAAKLETDQANAAKEATAVGDGPDSPLARIEKLCPTAEADVRKALVTTNLEERLAAYVSLSRRCSQSADIWGWLAKDHLAKGNAMSARAAAERALGLDKRNGDATAVLAELNRGTVENSRTAGPEHEARN